VSGDAVHICQLGPGDTALYRQLNAAFAAAFDDEAYRAAPPDEAYVARVLGLPHVIVLAARVDGAVVGGLVAYQLDKFEQDRREIYIYDLAVLEAQRRKGIARSLIQVLQRLASDRGAYVIFVQAGLDDAPAIALYRSLGVEATAHHYDVPVQPRRPGK
jgi:aminoglycoside 3-N-acetyltransferase I